MCGEFVPVSFYGESFGAQHAFRELVAEAIDHAVVGAHALLHKFRRYADHVRVADLAALDDSDDGLRAPSSPGCGFMQRMPTSAVSRASSTAAELI